MQQSSLYNRVIYDHKRPAPSPWSENHHEDVQEETSNCEEQLRSPSDPSQERFGVFSVPPLSSFIHEQDHAAIPKKKLSIITQGREKTHTP
jgi:hypothetical protein